MSVYLQCESNLSKFVCLTNFKRILLVFHLSSVEIHVIYNHSKALFNLVSSTKQIRDMCFNSWRPLRCITRNDTSVLYSQHYILNY